MEPLIFSSASAILCVLIFFADAFQQSCGLFEPSVMQRLIVSEGFNSSRYTVNEELTQYLNTVKKPVLPYKDETQYIDAYNDFYDEILS